MKLSKSKLFLILTAVCTILISPAVYCETPETLDSFTKSNLSDTKEIHGFKLQKTFSFENHPVYLYKHTKSGATVVAEKNNNADKKFEISFKTPAQNDKGANHIIEHCCLNGSREYPCKNMVWELSKAAYATFVNAMTFPLYTTFPVSSTDENELESLAKIYVSGVFHPMFLSDEKIFKKEGIRYEKDEKENLKANGTVFNEMQKDTDSISKFVKRMFPDTQDKNFSAGIPKDIMKLSYNECCETYKKYYHPSNAVIHLTGEFNHERFLKWLDEEYLGGCSCEDFCKVSYKEQDLKKIKKYETISYYKKDADKKMFETMICSAVECDNLPQLEIICSILNNPNSKAAEFFKQKGFQNANFGIIDYFFKPLLVLNLICTDEKLVTQETLESIMREFCDNFAISESSIDSAANAADFKFKFAQSTKIFSPGIDTHTMMMSLIRYGSLFSDHCFVTDKNGNMQKRFESRVSSQKLENVFKSAFISNQRFITVFTPCQNAELGAKHEIKKELENLEPQKQELTENYEFQKNWAESENSKEDINKLKNMFKKLSDIITPKFACDSQADKIENVPCYFHEEKTGDFISAKILFKINHLSDEDKKYIELLNNAFYFNNTKNYSRKKLEKMKSDKGIIGISCNVCENEKSEKNAFLILDVVFSKDKSGEFLNILNEQINNIDFKDITHIKEFLNLKSLYYSSMPETLLKFNEHVTCQSNYTANFLNGSQTTESKKKFTENMISNCENKDFLNGLEAALKNLKNKILNKNALAGMAVCAQSENKNFCKKFLSDFVNLLNVSEVNLNAPLNLKIQNSKNIAFVSEKMSNNTVVAVIDCKELSNDPKFRLTAGIVNDLFLVPQIREKGGAYGAQMAVDINNNLIIIKSVQDPNLTSTVDIFKSIPNFIKNAQFDSEQIENKAKNILGTLIFSDKLDIFKKQFEELIAKNSDYCADLNDALAKIKNVSEQDIKNHGEILEKAINNMSIYVLTGELKNDEKNIFDETVQ